MSHWSNKSCFSNGLQYWRLIFPIQSFIFCVKQTALKTLWQKKQIALDKPFKRDTAVAKENEKSESFRSLCQSKSWPSHKSRDWHCKIIRRTLKAPLLALWRTSYVSKTMFYSWILPQDRPADPFSGQYLGLHYKTAHKLCCPVSTGKSGVATSTARQRLLY